MMIGFQHIFSVLQHKIVSNARDDLPEPDNPLIQQIAFYLKTYIFVMLPAPIIFIKSEEIFLFIIVFIGVI